MPQHTQSAHTFIETKAFNTEDENTPKVYDKKITVMPPHDPNYLDGMDENRMFVGK